MEPIMEEEEYNWREVKLPSMIPLVAEPEPEPELERETCERRRGRDILIAVDHGPNSKHAFDWALVHLARIADTIHLIHAVSSLKNGLVYEAGQGLMEKLSVEAFEVAMVKTLARIVEGDAGKAICKEAERLKPAAVVMGTRGKCQSRGGVCGLVNLTKDNNGFRNYVEPCFIVSEVAAVVMKTCLLLNYVNPSNYERLNQHVFFCSKRPSFIHYGIAKHYHLFLLHEDILVLLDALPYSHFSNRYWFFVQSSLIPVLITQLRILLPYPYTMEKDEVHRKNVPNILTEMRKTIEVEEITSKQDELRNVSGSDIGALVVLRSAISGVLIPISNPVHEASCCSGLNWR
ncbi:hypothetical protein C3L33_20819, partial [Rhododendron williamsianum]